MHGSNEPIPRSQLVPIDPSAQRQWNSVPFTTQVPLLPQCCCTAHGSGVRQWRPLYPIGHMHANEEPISTQVPPFSQISREHGPIVSSGSTQSGGTVSGGQTHTAWSASLTQVPLLRHVTAMQWSTLAQSGPAKPVEQSH